MTLAKKLTSILEAANATTGKSDTNITDSTKSLIDGYGKSLDPVTLLELTVTENGEYLPPTEGILACDGFSKVTVNVPSSEPSGYILVDKNGVEIEAVVVEEPTT